ncbi:Crp/Fnr family transcriptional regulator [Marinobacter sp. 1Y8]
MTTSCIIKHFEHYSPLTDNDKWLLDTLEESPKAYPKSTHIWQPGDVAEHFYTLSNGWAYTYRNMEDGSRQVLDIYVPGDVIGLRELAFEKQITGLSLLTDAQLCAFPKTRLTEVFSESLLLSTIFFIITSIDQAILLERLVNLGRRSARQKLTHFMLEISTRLSKTNADVDNPLKLPLSQTLLADALGLSAVHVNRTFKALKEEALISATNGSVQLLDIPGLKQAAGFDPEYLAENVAGLLQHVRQMQHRIEADPQSDNTARAQ